jgi:DNA-binding CsgD family transcriptional regulator
MKFCVYIHRRKDNDSVMYVGHGTLIRANDFSVKSGRNKDWVTTVKEVGLYSEILFQSLSKIAAEDLEEDLIVGLLGLGVNLTNKLRKPSRGAKILAEDWDKLVYYNESSSSYLSWVNDRWTRHDNKGYIIRKAGSPAGSINNTTGYWHLRNIGIHRIVYALNYGECPAGLQVNHIDGDKSNNRISNLEAITALQNVQHAHRTGLIKYACGEDNSSAKVTKSQILQMYKMFEQGKSNSEVADYCKLHERYVSLVRHGKRWRKAYEEYGIIFDKSFTVNKITYEQVKSVLDLVDKGRTNKEISGILGIEVSQISRIRNGKTLKFLIAKVREDELLNMKGTK